MFAFALWDPDAEQLFLARDRLGIKPLYYHQDSRCLPLRLQRAGACSPLEMLTSRSMRSLLHHHLSLHAVVPAPRTLLRSIRKLAPGHHLTVGADGTIKEQSYWRLDAHNPDSGP